MQVHTPVARINDGDFPAYLNPGNGSPFVVVTLGDATRLHIESVADCDRLIRAAVDAKRLLAPPVTEPEPVIVYGDCNCGHDEDAHYLRQPEGDRGHCGATRCLCPLFDGAPMVASHA